MKKTIFSLIIMSLAVFAMSKTLSIESNVVEQTVLIDGSDQEWEGNRVYNDRDDVIFGIQHDDESLYVLFISRDTDLERQMLMNGFTLWVNDKGKTKKICGLNIPGMESNKRQNREEIKERNRENNFGDMMMEKIEIKPEFLLLKDKENDNVPYSNNELTGFDFARAQGDRGIVYEFMIPLHKADDQLFGFQKKDQKKISLGLECKAPERSEMSMGSGDMPEEDMPRGGGMRDGGGKRGGGMPGGRMPSQKDYNLWVKIEFSE
ncbi:MAG: hypothetical protein RAO94_05465 [Candidatus Stygibacter australis]|nr:hypothetical protein [Candidatus Stygibacter australis]MDP8321777.1 hypothetical protein [Candidatus Stygibacter australis]